MNAFQRFLLKIIWIFYPTKVYGAENLTDKSVILTCNHYSFIDPINLLRITNKKKTYLVAKKELFKNKLFGKILKSFGAIPIDREKPDITSIVTILKVLKNGDNLIIFPEGTRNKTKDLKLLELKNGAGIFAYKSKKTIVPIMMKSKPKLFRKTKIYIGKPFNLEQYYNQKFDDNLSKEINKFITNKMNEVLLVNNGKN